MKHEVTDCTTEPLVGALPFLSSPLLPTDGNNKKPHNPSKVEFTCDVEWPDSGAVSADPRLRNRRNIFPAELWESMFPYKERNIYRHEPDLHWTPRLFFENITAPLEALDADASGGADGGGGGAQDKWVCLRRAADHGHSRQAGQPPPPVAFSYAKKGRPLIVNYRLHAIGTFSEHFELHSYPFDSQDLQIAVQTARHDSTSSGGVAVAQRRRRFRGSPSKPGGGGSKHVQFRLEPNLTDSWVAPKIINADENVLSGFDTLKDFTDPALSRGGHTYQVTNMK